MTKLKAQVKKVLVFSRLVDAHDGLLSITNALMLVALWKLMTLKGISLPELTAFIVSLAAYVFKGHGKRKAALTEERVAKIEAGLGQAKEIAETVKNTVAGVANKVNQLDGRTAMMRRPGGL